ncbi:FAD-binding domain-containing protein [Asticcacaulis sp. AC402]|uniref:FAD-binding domain-containing protein n=1 Tax=Asticcacaulis sp. AC402 TaxID=1282361 RepID=UPI0003C3C82F|nr:FAD-binding domain-containing protein [Asticcacaulis sp. AC402]ESQ75280.1 hypothetical protein ABAC402_09250 [Asticcacaulis sp. AC402]
MDVDFPASRDAGIRRLADFVAKAGEPYARDRNIDAGPRQPTAVSRLSAYVRYRLISEDEIVAAVLAQHSLREADKFVQEILWRTYWKGWLELHPDAWTRFLAERAHSRESFHDIKAIGDAEQGRTGIAGFDDWALELQETGYLHNHARMWFASIWIFTLGLPWSLGADFFLRHLIDADAASNTLSWRWVAGLQTAGKTYLATRDNIARYTRGRFAPVGLAREARALNETTTVPVRPLPEMGVFDAKQASTLLITPEDFLAETCVPKGAAITSVVVASSAALLWGDKARQFVKAAAADAAQRASAHFQCPVETIDAMGVSEVIAAAQRDGTQQVITPYAPVGPVADALALLGSELAHEGIRLIPLRRQWDTLFWPRATKGFFAFKAAIPALLEELDLT